MAFIGPSVGGSSTNLSKERKGGLKMRKKMFIFGCVFLFTLIAFSVTPAHAGKKLIDIACCTTGGSTFTKFNAMAAIFSTTLDVKATGMPTTCPTENLYLYAKERCNMGLVVPSSFYFAYHGKPGPYKGKKKVDFMLHMFNADSTNMHMAVLAGKHPEIKSVADFRGRSIGMGPPASCGGMFLVALLEAYGMTLNDIKGHPGPGTQLVDMLRDGNTDVMTAAHGLPASAFLNLASTHKIRMIRVPPDIQKKITEKHPYYWFNPIKGGIYPYISEDISMLCETMACVASKDLSEDLVYSMMKEMWKHKEDLAAAHPAWKRMLEAEEGMFWPRVSTLHPGARKFYKELGFTDEELKTGKVATERMGIFKHKKMY
jgi:TRAP transporter TAXI family solute receptor